MALFIEVQCLAIYHSYSLLMGAVLCFQLFVHNRAHGLLEPISLSNFMRITKKIKIAVVVVISSWINFLCFKLNSICCAELWLENGYSKICSYKSETWSSIVITTEVTYCIHIYMYTYTYMLTTVSGRQSATKNSIKWIRWNH